MKTIILSLFIGINMLAATGCKDPDCQKPSGQFTNSIITGVDYRKCACCGGLMITFSNDPRPNSAEFFDISQMPPNSGISENSEFPVYVKVKYSKTQSCGQRVNILELQKR